MSQLQKRVPKGPHVLEFAIIVAMWKVFGPGMALHDAMINYGKLTAKLLGWFEQMMGGNRSD